MKKILKGSAAVILAIAAANVSAQDDYYVGIGYGEADNSACDAVTNVVVLECNDNKTTWKGVFGYNFHDHFSVEFAYNHLGDFSATEQGATPEIINGVTGDGIAYSLALLGKIDLANDFKAFAKLGFANWHFDYEAKFNNVRALGDDSGTDLMFGLGIMYDEGTGHQLRLEWDRFNDISYKSAPVASSVLEYAPLEKDYIDTISIVYSFSF